MRYQITQKIISVGDDFRVRDENGRDVFFVDGFGFSFGNKLSFQTMQKKELLLIRQSLMTFMPRYKLLNNGETVATVRKAALAFRPSFVLHFPRLHKQVKISGRLLENEYFFKDGSRILATVSKKWFRASDTYAVDISVDSQHEIYLAAAIVVDLICHDKASKHKRRGRATS